MVQHPASVVSQSYLLVWGGSGIVWGRWKPTDSLPMTGAQTQTVEAWMRAKTSPRRVVLRSRIYLPAAEGLPNNAMAHRWETSRPTVRLWRTGFNEAGPVGSVRGCPAWASAHRLSPRKVRASVEATRQTTPPDATHWRTPKESAMPAWRRSRTRTAGTRTGSKRSSGRRPRGVWRR
jgi:hypothetical protein